MKKFGMAMLLAALLMMMTGCSAVDEALGKIGDDMKAAKLDSPTGPQAAAGSIRVHFLVFCFSDRICVFADLRFLLLCISIFDLICICMGFRLRRAYFACRNSSIT